MKREFIVALRNPLGQILVLQDLKTGEPVLPGGTTDHAPLTHIRKALDDLTGLDTQGFHLVSTRQVEKREVHLFTAYVRAGRLVSFPTVQHLSASWVAPGLVMRLIPSPEVKELMHGLAWMQEGPPA